MSEMTKTDSPIRIVIIDDQAAIRQTLSTMLEAEPDLQVVGRAGDGEEGLKVVFQAQPDLILLDLEMPRMDGFAFLRLLMAKRPTPVVVVSSHASRESVFKALELGALEFVAKPVRHGMVDLSGIRVDLLSKVRLARRLRVVSLTEQARAASERGAQSALHGQRPRLTPTAALEAAPGTPDRLLCIGASTGGPTSIMTLLSGLEVQPRVAVLITQHMPESFTRAFAERLERVTRWTTREAEPGALVQPGQVLVAPGGWSMRVAREGGALRVQPPLPGESRDQGFVPSVDRMLEAAAVAMGPAVVAVILTGMSGDGVRGASAVHTAGGRVLAEAPESAVIAGMPEEVIRAGIAHEVLPLRRMPEVLRRLLRG
jgi:two-component system chemotaxis response regulator CheB